MSWRLRNVLLVVAAAIAVLLLVQSDVTQLLMRPFFEVPVHGNAIILQGKDRHAESAQTGLHSASLGEFGSDTQPDKEGDTPYEEEHFNDAAGENSDEYSDDMFWRDYGHDADDYDYADAVNALPSPTEQPPATRQSHDLDWLLGEKTTAYSNDQDSTEDKGRLRAKSGARESSSPLAAAVLRLKQTEKSSVQLKIEHSTSSHTYASTRKPAVVFAFNGTGRRSDESEMLPKNGDLKIVTNRQLMHSIPRSRLVSAATSAGIYTKSESAAVTDSSTVTSVTQPSRISSTLPEASGQESAAGLSGQLRSVSQSQATNSIISPEENDSINVSPLIPTATEVSGSTDGDHVMNLNAVASVPTARLTQDETSFREPSQRITLSNDTASKARKSSNRPTRTPASSPAAKKVSATRSSKYVGDVTVITSTAAIAQSGNAMAIVDELTAQSSTAAAARAPGSLVNGTSARQGLRSTVSTARSTESAKNGDGPAVGSSNPLSMGMTPFSEKSFLVSAYSDFRRNPPTVKIVVFARKDFKEVVSCLHGNVTRTARLSWINYVTEERALWRAGYLECEVPAMTIAAGDTIVELRSSSAAPDTAGVIMPVSHTQAPPLSKPQETAAAVSGSRASGVNALNFTFAVCVKSGYGMPSAQRFVEWMELHCLLGVAHVILYDQDLRGPIRVAMQHYVNAGKLTVVLDEFRSRLEQNRPDLASLFSGFDATFASGDEPYAQMELLSIQDCFHRFRGSYDYILVADIDEAIVPVSTDTLPGLAEALKRKHPNATSFSHQAAAYLPHFVSAAEENSASPRGTGESRSSNYSRVSGANTDSLYMLRHTRRTGISWDGSKAFHSTGDTDVLNWHRRIWPDVNFALVNPSDAWLHHYRGSCKGASCNPNAILVDDGPVLMGRYAEALSSRVVAVLSHLHPLPSHPVSQGQA